MAFAQGLLHTVLVTRRIRVDITNGIHQTGIMYSRIAWYNFSPRARGTTLELKRVEDALVVHARIPRGWNVRAGQYVYLWVPGASPLSFMQSHPFIITQWNGEGSVSDKITMLLKVRNGFTRHLAECAPRSGMRTVVDGPYGEASCYGQYGTVLLLATGIGIVAHIPHVKEILQGHKDRAVQTRQVMLVWQVDREAQENWVSNWMQELLEMDKDMGSNMLRVRLYVSRDFKEESSKYGITKEYGEHDRLRKLYGEVDLDALFDREVHHRLGKMLISVAATEAFRDRLLNPKNVVASGSRVVVMSDIKEWFENK
ncbi:MAG: hypothetical protein MMC23_006302 [Stictis urceolatum]|nr:hypothetical protein [Stictis urceolata]